MSGPNPLVSLRSYFYLGLYDQLTKEAKTIGTLTGSTETERLAYVYRAYVAMGKHRKVAVEIKKGAPTVLQVIQLHSTYRTAKTDESRSMALDKLNEMVIHITTSINTIDNKPTPVCAQYVRLCTSEM
mmetsp:Transcript_20328/g.32209  ORF Transcript_20328/g.32209 Transcript_20328/m.32209 type:complete len:128 (-) Transcript_20328:19-402(-)|eukprot:59574-Amorphochlora_amoeboformis.AAC.2